LQETTVSKSLISFQELQEANQVEAASPNLLPANDGIQLSYRCYVPASPCAVVLFYHSGGAHSGLGYQHIGHGLQTQFNMAVYTPDIRGHGNSGGRRGDSVTTEQAWSDITTFIQRIRAKHPSTPVFLGGHASGAGMALNYAGQPGHELVDGYIFLSPYFGYRSQTDRPDVTEPFVKADVSAFAAHAMSRGAKHSHDYAVQLNYPAEILAEDSKLVTSLTVTMSDILTPFAPREQMAILDRPFGLWVGSEDELLLPDQVIALADLAQSVRAKSQADIIPGVKQFSMLLKAHEVIGPWVKERIQHK
jgi:acylglycerol lipase